MNSIKHRTVIGLAWNFAEKFAIRLLQFIISIILARLLSPDDFGLIAIIMFFLNISQIFIESGLSQALIQKKDRKQEDYSTVFVFKILTSLCFYAVLFLTAPLVSFFYEEPQLTSLIRVLSLILVLNSLVVVPNVKLLVDVDFKKLAKINVSSVMISGWAGVACAYIDFGVWALVVQSLVYSVVNCILFYCLGFWKISFHFSKESLRSMFRFSSNILIAGFFAQITKDIYNLLIGRFFTMKELGYYHRANTFSILASDSVSQSIQQVTFPILSQMQGDKEVLISSYKKMMRMSAFVIFPVMALLSALADPTVKFLLTEEWVPVIPLLQWIVFSRLFYPLEALNHNILKATGRSDLFLKMDLLTLPFTIIVLIVTIPLGIKAMVIGQVVSTPFCYAITTIMPGRLYGYNFLKQSKDIIPYALAAGVLYGVAYATTLLSFLPITKLALGGVLGGISYLLVCRMFKVNEIKELKKIIFNRENC